MPDDLKKISNIIGGLSDKEIKKLTWEKYQDLVKKKFKNQQS